MAVVDISLILPINGTQAELEVFLADINGFAGEISWELIVIDDASNEKLSLGNWQHDNWRIIHHEEQRGAAAARNTGAEDSSGDHLVFMSSFLSYPSDYIDSLNKFISDREFDFAQHPITTFDEKSLDPFQRFIGNQHTRVKAKGEFLPIKQSLFTAAVIKRETFELIKGFDPEMKHYGGHEMDFIFRMDKAGFNRRLEIKEIILKRRQIPDKLQTLKRLREYGRTGLPNLLQKHPELKGDILPQEWLWRILAILGLTRAIERCLSKTIDKNRKLSHSIYRLYLHLVVRNAWDAR
ncbi:MAG: glycosyltransferase [Candidatus Marinimicrobia bacterium]|nr:glycosyltransferase [Candidatus Neomarinimicrobiota bacterium]MCF7903857.1 glycosyltransferase [Candidatus Neomarinimicrobiota bacterium]